MEWLNDHWLEEWGIFGWIQSLFRATQRAPLIGPIFRVGVSAHLTVLREAFITLSLSTIPFWLGGFVLLLLTKAPKTWQLYIAAIQQTSARGELLVVGPALLSPVVLLVWKSWPVDRVQQGTLVLSSGAIMILSTVPFALALAKAVPDQSFLVKLSWISLVSSIVVLYLYMIGEKLQPADIGVVQNIEEVDLKERLLRRREGKG